MYRPVTERMLIKMQECKEMEAETGRSICHPSHFGYSLPGLYKRGLVAVKNYVDETGKKLLGVYLTQKGHLLLNEQKEKLKEILLRE